MEEKKIPMTEEDAEALVDFLDRIQAGDIVDLYGRSVSMARIQRAMAAVVHLRGELVSALRE